MKKICFIGLFFIASLSIFAQQNQAPSGGGPVSQKPTNRIIGLGGMAGTQVGMSLFLYNFEINVVYSYLFGQSLGITADFFHPDFYIRVSDIFYISFGTGIYVDFYFSPRMGPISNEYAGTGLRVPIEFSWYPQKNTEVFFEPAIGISFVPQLGFYWQLNVGSRYYFDMTSKK